MAIDSSFRAEFKKTIGATCIEADAHSYTLTHSPRGRICRLVATRPGSKGQMTFAACSPLTNLQRAIISAKQLGWLDEKIELKDVAC